MRKFLFSMVALLVMAVSFVSFQAVGNTSAPLAPVTVYRSTTLSDSTPALLSLTIESTTSTVTDVRLFYASSCLQIPTESYTGYVTKHGWGYHIHSFYVYPSYLSGVYSHTDGAATTGQSPCDGEALHK
ncbi:hypothetical protein [Paraflavitalea pollutisoli]|uniref:hypothetical protein n=1 Tax=Paraflavitalea pollutisoli TaxID=3034143 RepID=UPI0023ED72E9|nr:hypothetical protein [Paraflavitalea sp. H1-2-19X]